MKKVALNAEQMQSLREAVDFDSLDQMFKQAWLAGVASERKRILKQLNDNPDIAVVSHASIIERTP